ncbi:MAG: CubicO group peptidase (beta-lactamase class C family), partial [Pseudohongiellaceae bacterium]
MFNNFYRLCASIFLSCVFPLINAQSLSFSAAESVGLSTEGLEKVTMRLQRHIDDGDISGVVAAVIRDGKIVYLKALGQRDIEKSLPMTDDTLFRIYSMTR